MGNIEDPLNLPIRNYQGSSATLDIEDFSFEQYSYPDAFYDNKYVLVLPNPDSLCRAAEVRIVTHVTHNTGGTNEKFNFSPGLAPNVDPPGGLSGTCASPERLRRGHDQLHQRQGILARRHRELSPG